MKTAISCVAICCLSVSVLLLSQTNVFSQPAEGVGSLFRERADAAINLSPIGQSDTGSAYVVVVDQYGGIQFFPLGVADPGIGSPPDEETLFPMMSNSKVLAGSYFSLVLLQRGISLDAPAADWTPPGFAPLNPDLTIRHLLTHTHGYPDWPNQPIGWTVNALSAWLTGVTPKPPGGTPKYTSTGLMIAAAISANVEQRGFIDSIRELLFDRLEMTRTGYNLREEPNQAMPVGPNWRGDLLATTGSLYSTPKDMAKFLLASVGVGPSDIVDAIRKAQRENLGWNATYGISSLGYYWHSGAYGEGLNLFSAIRVNPTNGTAAVVMTASRTIDANDSGMLADAMLGIAAQPEFVSGIR